MLFYLLMVGPRFQNWDPRIRPLGGNFTDNLIYKTEILNSSIQRPKNRKFDPRFVEDCFIISFFHLLAAERLAQHIYTSNGAYTRVAE